MIEPCEDNECQLGFNECIDRMVSLRFFLWMKEEQVDMYEQNKKELEWFTYCPHCGFEIKELLKKYDIKE